MKNKYSRVSVWLFVTIAVWFLFGFIYWVVPKTFKVTDIKDEIFLKKSKEVTSLVFEGLFRQKEFRCDFRNDNIMCRGKLERKVCLNSGECLESDFHIVLTTNEINEKEIRSSIYLVEDSEERLFGKASLTILWPQLEQYLLKTAGFYLQYPEIINFSKIKNKLVTLSDKSIDFHSVVEEKSIIDIRGNKFINLKLDDGYLEDLETVLVSYSNNPSFNRALYFSGITLLSIGYGDIVPVSGLGRMLAILEGFLGLILMAIIAVVFYDTLKTKGQN